MSERVETAEMQSEVYKYRGDASDIDVVAAVKAHHAEKHDCKPSDLIGRKIAEGGNNPQQAYIAIIEWEV